MLNRVWIVRILLVVMIAACAPPVDSGAEEQQSTQQAQASDRSPPSQGSGSRHIVPGSNVRWFATPGEHVQTEGRVIRDPNELDAAWDQVRDDRATNAERSAPMLHEGETAVLANFSYRGTGSCRVEVELAAVEIREEQTMLVFEPSGREPCISPAGVWMVAAILPADAAGVAEVQRVVTVERG